MVVPPALNPTALPPPEVWDDDADFDFGGDANDPNTTAFSTLRRPASFTSDVDIFDGEAILDTHSGSSGNGDHHPHHRGPASVSGSASSRTSRSGMSSSAHTYRSTDLTDPEGSPANSFHGGDIHNRKTADSAAGLSPQRAYDTGRPLSTSPTALDHPFSNFRRGAKHTGAGSPSAAASGAAQRRRQNSHEIASNSSEHEFDFELGEEVSQLHLAPTTLRKRPSSSLEQDRLTLWGDNESPATGMLAADAEIKKDQAGGATGGTRTSPSPSRNSAPDSDNDGALGDDESEAAEPIEEGLDLPDSIFGSPMAAADGVVPSTMDRPSAKLRAILDARLRGQHLSSAQSTSTPTKSTSELLAGGVLDFDADTDVVTGLVITDDLDLSPSRLAAKSLSFKIRKGLGFGMGGAGSNTVPRSQFEQSRAGNGPSSKAERARPSGTNVRTWNSSSASSNTTQLPTVVLTNSSPAQPERTQTSSQRSPPRALSSFSHAPGAGPRMYAFPTSTSPSARSSGNADSIRSASPSGPGHQQHPGPSVARKSPTLLSPDGFSGPTFLGVDHASASSQHHQRRQSLVRKQSMPVLLSDQASGNKHASTSAALSAVHASITANASALSRLMASTASSRAREAETAARMAARASTAAGEADADRNSPTSRLPPSRPSTPVNGAVRYTLSTGASRIRRMGGGGADGLSSRPSSSSGTQGRSTPNMYSAITASAAAAKDAARVMRRPTRARHYGTGNELDGFDDLPTSQEAESRFRRTPLRQASNANSMTMSSLVGDETLKVRPRDLPQLFTPVKDSGSSTLTSKNVSQICGSQNAVAGPSSSAQRTSSRAGSRASSGTAGAVSSSVRQRSSRSSSAANNNNQPPRSRRPTLIRNMGGNSNNRSRVVGDMRWNPVLQRWEGNESALRAFDNVINSSIRPALISPLTTSSVNSLMSSSSSLFTLGGSSHSTLLGSRKSITALAGAASQSRPSAASSPVAGRGSISGASAAPVAPASIPASTSNSTSFGDSHSTLQGTRVVGDMIFDPQRLCWLSMAGTEEPDVFANMGEDDDDDDDDDEDFFGSGANGTSKAAAEGGKSQLLLTAGDAASANRDGAESGILSSSSRQHGSSTVESTAGGGWSSGWGVGARSGAGRSSIGSTMDDEDEEEMSKSVGYPDSGAVQAKNASGATALLAAHPVSSQQQQQASSGHSQQQSLTARRIRSADLLRTIPATGSSMDYASVYLAQGPSSGAKTSAPAAISTSTAVSTASVTDYDDEELERLCREAETRHRAEMRGFLPKGATDVNAKAGNRAEVDPRSHLYLLQRLAREACR
ncbi:hypothetical protein OC846_000226 [Tilletia horrida]|uniref:Uncharacterized protein n=1 Tax=Tilletia horrida TaxID=155126 RepID=A0AAN6K164_9BASI|nr:hypothetical protein OC846_000226 [Tilletia horrida]